MTPTGSSDGTEAALRECAAVMMKLSEVIDRHGLGVREELVRIEEAIRDTATVGHGRRPQ